MALVGVRAHGDVGTWGSSFGTGVATELALWNEDNFGEDLLLNLRDGGDVLLG